jgi:hypothetical protein
MLAAQPDRPEKLGNSPDRTIAPALQFVSPMRRECSRTRVCRILTGLWGIRN